MVRGVVRTHVIGNDCCDIGSNLRRIGYIKRQGFIGDDVVVDHIGEIDHGSLTGNTQRQGDRTLAVGIGTIGHDGGVATYGSTGVD